MNSNISSRHQGTMASRCPPQSFWITSISSKSCQGVAVDPAAWDRMRQPPRQLTSVSDRSEASRGSLSISAMRHSCWDSIPNEARSAKFWIFNERVSGVWIQVVRAPHLRKTMSAKNITLENAESALPSHLKMQWFIIMFLPNPERDRRAFPG